jgi:hypothetical protein
MKNWAMFIILAMSCCNSVDRDSKSENTLAKTLLALDSTFRSSQLELAFVDEHLSSIDSLLGNSISKSFDNEQWETNAEFKSNQDSSIVLIHATKRHKHGFRRETILHFKDSILLIRRFEVLTEDPSVGYELLETLDYLSSSRNIKNLVKREYPTLLSDTVNFKRLPFFPYDGTMNQFQAELQYAVRIMNRN